jgi:hypothetical protein
MRIIVIVGKMLNPVVFVNMMNLNLTKIDNVFVIAIRKIVYVIG